MSNAGSLIQKAYLIERAEQIVTFARALHARLGRGVVVIEWPLPDSLKPEEMIDHSNYLPEQMLSLVGLDTTEELVRTVRRYDPKEQAIVLCVEADSRSFSMETVRFLGVLFGEQASFP